MTAHITFEHPLNEKCRTLLRLSNLFNQLEFHQPHADQWHTRAAIRSLLDVAGILARADIKSELIKEMERYNQSLSKMAGAPGVDDDRLSYVLQDLRQCSEAIRNIGGQLGQGLRNNEFLNGILQRSCIAGGGFDFDLPQFHAWLNLPHPERAIQMDDWRHEISPVQDAVDLLLNLIRSSSIPSKEEAESGFFQKSLPSGTASQLVQVVVPNNTGLFAEISGSKHRFSIRFLETADWEHPKQTGRDVPFGLNICII